MFNNKAKEFKNGMQAGFPIFLGYLAVSFSLGIAAKNAGLTAFQAFLASLTTNASAGEFAAFTVMAAGGTYLELAVMEFVANVRYVLMSCALSQKLGQDTSIWHRLLIGTDVTDEIFGVSISRPGKLNPFYTYGVIVVAAPGWAGGTYLGVLCGNILPAGIVSALSVGLYGMFLAIIIPPARKNKVLGVLVLLSMAASFAFARIPVFAGISSGVKIIILTVVISALAAILFPVDDADEDDAKEKVGADKDGA